MLLGSLREAALVSFATDNRHRLSAKDQRMIAGTFLDPRNSDIVLMHSAATSK